MDSSKGEEDGNSEFEALSYACAEAYTDGCPY